MKSKRPYYKGDLLAGGLLSIACLLAFAPAFGATFAPWDDRAFIHQNPLVAGGWNLRMALGSLGHVWENNWVPLTWNVYAIQVSLSGAEPSPVLFHSVTVCLHAVVAVLVFSLCRVLGASTIAALAGAAVFALHPQRVEVVAWVASQKHLLATAFALGSVLVFLRPGKLALGVSVGLFALAMLSAQSPAMLPFVLIMLVPLAGRRWMEVAPFFLIAGAAGLAPVLANYGSDASLAPWYLKPFGERLLQAPASVAWHLCGALWPVALVPAYPWPGNIRELAFAGMACVVAIVLLGWWLRLRVPLASGAILATALLIFPTLGLIPLPNEFTADRFTYLPGVAVAVGLAALATRWRSLRVVLLVAAPILGVLASGTTAHWKSEEAILDHTLAHFPQSRTARINKAVVLANRGDTGTALELLRAVRTEQPERLTAWTNELLLLNALGRPAEAVRVGMEALETSPENAELHLLVGEAAWNESGASAALPHFRRAYDLVPDSTSTIEAYARALVELGEEPDVSSALLLRLEQAGRLPDWAVGLRK